MEEIHLGFLLHNRAPGKQKSEAKSILWRGGSSSHDPGDCASNVSFSLWSGLRTLLGYLAWMQLSGTELVVESERLSDQADRGLEKPITSSVHVASAHMETRVHLFVVSAVTTCM